MKVRIHLVPLVDREYLSEEDTDLYDEYTVEVHDDVPLTDIANAALDVFHSNVAVDCVEDFRFIVMDTEGNVLDESYRIDSYIYSTKGKMV